MKTIKLLHLETSTKVCSVAISENGHLVDFMEESSEQYIHAEKLTVFIQEIIRKNNWSFSDLDGISVAGGPGSYTGLRIGVSTAKGLCYVLNIPLISVGSLESLIQIAQKKYVNQSICAMIDARRMEVFSLIGDKDFSIIKELSADVLDENSYQEYESFVACGDGSEKIVELWGNRNVIIDTKILSSAIGQIKIAYSKFQQNDFENVAYYEPLYLKNFVALKSKKNPI